MKKLKAKQLLREVRSIIAGASVLEDNPVLSNFEDSSWNSLLDGSYGLSIPYVDSIKTENIVQDLAEGVLYVDICATVPFKVNPWWRKPGFLDSVEKDWGSPLHENAGKPFERYFWSNASEHWGPHSNISLYGSYIEPFILVEDFISDREEYSTIAQQMTKKFSKEYKLSKDYEQAVKQVSSLLKEMDNYSTKLLKRLK